MRNAEKQDVHAPSRSLGWAAAALTGGLRSASRLGEITSRQRRRYPSRRTLEVKSGSRSSRNSRKPCSRSDIGSQPVQGSTFNGTLSSWRSLKLIPACDFCSEQVQIDLQARYAGVQTAVGFALRDLQVACPDSGLFSAITPWCRHRALQDFFSGDVARVDLGNPMSLRRPRSTWLYLWMR